MLYGGTSSARPDLESRSQKVGHPHIIDVSGDRGEIPLSIPPRVPEGVENPFSVRCSIDIPEYVEVHPLDGPISMSAVSERTRGCK